MICFSFLFITVLIGTVSCVDEFGSLTSENSTDPIVINTYAKDVTANVDFFLYTQKSPTSILKTRITDRRLFGGKIDVNKPVKILIHGYMSHKDKSFSKVLREAYLEKGDYNVVNVDWSKDAYAMYHNSRNDVPAVGKVVAKFIDRLVTDNKLSMKQVHVLGHSLGAHIAGVAGLNVQTGQISRVTGLDPAGPLFSEDVEERLKPSSAAFVDVIHSCGNGLGFFGDLGHVDFYPNGGTCSQPGCTLSLGICSHKRATEYFVESVSTPDGFLGRKCDTWEEFKSGKCDENPTAVMGENVGHDARGKYWLWTANKSAFALGLASIDSSGKRRKRISSAALQ